MGVACGVAAVVGMTMSAQTALKSFSKAIEFLRGKATHSIQRPAGPMEEGLLLKLGRDPAVEWFSPVIDRRLRLGNGELVRLLGIDPFLDRTIRPEILKVEFLERKANDPENLLSFLIDEKAIFVDNDLKAELGITSDKIIETAKGPLHVKGSFPNPSGEPLVIMDIGHVQKLYQLQAMSIGSTSSYQMNPGSAPDGAKVSLFSRPVKGARRCLPCFRHFVSTLRPSLF